MGSESQKFRSAGRSSGRMRISVALCTHNGSRFLREQLQSILDQTRPPDELVFCDDRSTDETVAVARELSARTAFPVRIEINSENLGATKNFEKAIGLCTGDVIVLSDQDDVWNPNKLQRIEEVLDGAPDVGAVFSDAELIDQDSQPQNATLWSTFRFTKREQRKFAEGDGLAVLLKHSTVTGATMAFRSQFRDLVLPIPSSHVHDGWIAMLIGLVSHLAPIATPLIKYRRHSIQQIGPGSWDSLSRAAGVAKQAGRQHYLEEVKRLNELLEHSRKRADRFPMHPGALSRLQAKIRHREVRGTLPARRVMRLPYVIGEIATRRYWRYSSGIGSLAKDLVVE